MKKFYLFLSLLWLTIHVSLAQNKVFVLDTTNSGIPSNLVASMLFDSNDHLWVGTNTKGIGHFDGTNWAYYNAGNTPGLLSNYINDIKEHPNGDMYFGTGLGITVKSGNTWTTYDTSNFSYYTSGTYYNPYQIYVQFDSQGDAYTVTHGGNPNVIRVYKFDGTSWTMLHEDTAQVIPSTYRYPRDFIIDNNDHIWVKNGYRFDGSNWTEVPRPSVLGDYYESGIAIDTNGIVWTTLENLNTVKTAIAVSHNGANYTLYDSVRSSSSFLTWDMFVSVDPNTNHVWYANMNAGTTHRWFDGSVWHWDVDLEKAMDSAGGSQFSDFAVKAMAYDNKGNKWIGMNNADEYRKQNPDNGGIVIFNENGVDLSDFAIGMEELDELNVDWQVYPNPSNGSFNVSISNAIEGHLEVYSIQGVKVFETPISSLGVTQVKLSPDVQDGVYVVNLVTKHGVSSKKVRVGMD